MESSKLIIELDIRIYNVLLYMTSELRTLGVRTRGFDPRVAEGMQVFYVTGDMQVFYVAGGIQVYYVAGGVQV